MTIHAKSDQLEMDCKLDTHSQRLNRDPLNPTERAPGNQKYREDRICFTFYPIAPPGRDVKFKYSTELPFCIP